MQYLLIYAAGGLLYGLIEILWRGWTHWSMVLCGGLCFLMMYLISGLPLCLMKKCVLSSAAICTAEFYTGCLVNLRLGWNVWDYSAEGLNLLGQICPRFALLAAAVRARTLVVQPHQAGVVSVVLVRGCRLRSQAPSRASLCGSSQGAPRRAR